MEPQLVSNDGGKPQVGSGDSGQPMSLLWVLILSGVASKSEFESGRTKSNYKQGRKAQMKPPSMVCNMQAGEGPGMKLEQV